MAAHQPSDNHPPLCGTFTIYARGHTCLEPGGSYIEWTGMPADEEQVLAALDFVKSEVQREFQQRRETQEAGSGS